MADDVKASEHHVGIAMIRVRVLAEQGRWAGAPIVRHNLNGRPAISKLN